MQSHSLMTIAINNNHCCLVDNPVHPVVFGHLNTVAFDTRNIAMSTALVQASSHAWQLDPINFIPNNKLNIRLEHSTSATLPVTACQPLDCNFASMSLNSKHLVTSCRKVRPKSRYGRPFISSFMQSPVHPAISAIICLRNTCFNRSAFALRNFWHNTYAPGYTF